MEHVMDEPVEYFVEYYIAGNPLPHTRIVKFDKGDVPPAEVCDALKLGQNIMKVSITFCQDTVTDC